MFRQKPQKPQEVFYAELALWGWTAWACLFGIYQTWRQIPVIEEALSDQLQGMITLDPNSLLEMAIAGYAGLAVISAWIVYKIGQGKRWARSSLLWGFAIEVLVMLIPPYHAPLEYISDIPELGLQIYALYYLYAAPSREWFDEGKGV